MALLQTYFLGVRLWIWLYFLFSIISLLVVLIYLYRERIRKTYYNVRFPEKVLKCIIHYTSGIYKVFWRVIPDDKHFTFQNKLYNYEEKKVIKEHDFFVRKEDDKQNWITIEGHKYNLNEKLKLKEKGRKYPEIHFWFNNPNPIGYNFESKKVDLTGKQMKEFRENDLFAKLLTLREQTNIMIIIMIMQGLNIILSAFIIAKIMGWLDK